MPPPPLPLISSSSYRILIITLLFFLITIFLVGADLDSAQSQKQLCYFKSMIKNWKIENHLCRQGKMVDKWHGRPWLLPPMDNLQLWAWHPFLRHWIPAQDSDQIFRSDWTVCDSVLIIHVQPSLYPEAFEKQRSKLLEQLNHLPAPVPIISQRLRHNGTPRYDPKWSPCHTEMLNHNVVLALTQTNSTVFFFTVSRVTYWGLLWQFQAILHIQ